MVRRTQRTRGGIPRRAFLAAGVAFAGGAAIASPPGQGAVSVLGWWLGNSTAPTFRINVPAESVRGDAVVTVDVDPVPSWSFVEAQVDGKVIPVASSMTINTRNLTDGNHVLKVAVRDNSFRRNTRWVETRLVSDNTAPKVTVSTKEPGARQGRTGVLQVTTDEPAMCKLLLSDDRQIAFSKEGNDYLAFVGFDAFSTPGKQQFQLVARDIAGNESTTTVPYDLVKFEYPLETLVVAADLVKLIVDGAYDNEEKKLNEMSQSSVDTRIFEGQFEAPARGVISSTYGLNRTYNADRGTLVGKSRHLGLDFDVPVGAPINAPAKGRVMHAGPLQVRGNAVMLDHGIGITSVYAHLSRIDVKVGDLLNKGQQIGLAGQTGLVTGPHLHWEVRLGGNAVDPAEWLQRKFV